MYLDWLNDRLKYMNKGIVLNLLFFGIFIDFIYLWILYGFNFFNYLLFIYLRYILDYF